MATYGIDLGTTYSAIATLDDSGRPVIIENQNDAKPILASAIYFPQDESNPPVVGEEAKNMVELEGDRVIQFIKRDIGKENGRTFQFGSMEFNPITISSLVLKRLAEYAGEQGNDVKDVVITCPAYFGIPEREATRQAGEVAGFNVLSIINEPTAAALNYCAREVGENRTIMVYDLGGGTFDVSILKMTVDNGNGANIDIISTDGNDRLGGKDWDDRLFQHLLNAYCNENGSEPNDAEPELRQAIRSKVEELKKKLTQNESKNTTISYGGSNTKIEVSREQFNDMTKDLVAQTMGFIDSIFSKSGLNESNIDVLLLVGGSTRMPMIKDAIEQRFPGKWRMEDPDLAVAKGAALYSAMIVHEQQASGAAPTGGEQPQSARPALPPGIKSMTVQDKTPRSFGPGVMFGNNYMIDNLIFVGEVSPREIAKEYGTMFDNQPKINLRIFENVETTPEKPVTPCIDINGDEQTTDPLLKVKNLGELNLELQPNTPKNSPIEVYFKLDVSKLYVRATDKLTGKTVDATMDIENTMKKEELQTAISQMAAIKTSGESD
ncbi:molecular chaperone DnaK [Spirochaetia bacterium]|nr:molecular chaperone DnaK [Spirochaetia bacterium]